MTDLNAWSASCGLIDCPEATLGSLEPSLQSQSISNAARLSHERSEGEIIVNGVVMPKLVLDQIQRLGISAAWYTTGELEAAVNNCAIDCTLIDDPDGLNFIDDLTLTEDKIEANEGLIEEPWRASESHIKSPEAFNPFYPTHAILICELREADLATTKHVA